MTTLALVPVKALSTAKSRLASELCPDARRSLVLDMLSHTLDTLLASRDVSRIVVVTPDDEVIRLATARQVETYRHPGRLNIALEAARSLAAEFDRLLITLADLPLVLPSDIQAMHRLALNGHDVVIAPDGAGHGTNLMLLTPPDTVPFFYGSHSCQRHTQWAQKHHLQVATYNSPTTSLDVDTPADLDTSRLLAPRC